MNELRLDGFFVREAYFTPCCSKHAGELCAGVQIYVTDFETIDPPLMGLMLMDAIREQAGSQFEWTGSIDRLLGTKEYREGKCDGRTLIEKHRQSVLDWQKRSEAFYLY